MSKVNTIIMGDFISVVGERCELKTVESPWFKKTKWQGDYSDWILPATEIGGNQHSV